MCNAGVAVNPLEAGDIGFAHFSLLAGTARALSAQPAHPDVESVPDDASGDDLADPLDPATPVGSLPFDEHTLLELARDHSVGRFIHDCNQARHAHDAAAVLAEHVSAAEPQPLRVHPL